MMAENEYVQSTSRVVMYVYLYVFLEWLFFVTKPSFLSAHSWMERIAVLFTGVWPFVTSALALHILMCIISWISKRLGLRRTSPALLRFIPALIIASTVLILVDNFTYTVFRWGIVKTTPYSVPLYWLLFAAAFVFALRHDLPRTRIKPRAAAVLLGVSAILLAWSSIGSELGKTRFKIDRPRKPLPNIIFFASDGVNASHLSAYGYALDTSPNLDKWMSDAMVAENAFTNAATTTGSTTSMMTGKYPATTKVFYPPQTLHGEDAYQHLPGILRQLGYDSIQETVPYYADALELNWADSFNYANGRKLRWALTSAASAQLQTAAQFARTVRDRFQDRAGQVLLTKPMNDNFAAVTSEAESGNVVSDAQRMNRIFYFIQHAREPFLVHVHLMGTHCCKWHSSKHAFPLPSRGEPDRSDAAFDNAVLASDGYFGQMMDLLKSRHLLDNTVVVYTSDHAKGWDFRSQVPLIFIFPHGEYKGRIAAPTQLIDVAPTLLDYIGANIPDWMEGRSLLKDDLPPDRPIFSAFFPLYPDEAAHHANIGPPLYDFEKIGLVVCNRWYILTLTDGKMTSGNIATFHGSCDPAKIPTLAGAQNMISTHLHERGIKF